MLYEDVCVISTELICVMASPEDDQGQCVQSKDLQRQCLLDACLQLQRSLTSAVLCCVVLEDVEVEMSSCRICRMVECRDVEVE